MSENTECSSLPRGLVTRKGLVQTSTQRLPSLRSESNASQISPFVANTTTKGGVVKRTFKPTIPPKRNITDGSQSSNQLSANTSQSKRGRNAGRNWRNSPRGYDESKYVQLGATLFNGDRTVKVANNTDNIARKAANRRVTFKEEIESKNGSREHVSIKTEPNIKIEQKTGSVLRKLYGDNFIDDEEDDYGSNDLLPKRWEAVSNHRVGNRSVDQTISPYELFRSAETEKFLFLQFPEAILRRHDGHIGKIRVYKSGRIELEDNESGTKFDIVYSNHNIPQVKSEHNLLNKPNGIYAQDISQDVVSFDGNHLSLLGSIKQQQVLLAVPQLPLDEQIGPSIQL